MVPDTGHPSTTARDSASSPRRHNRIFSTSSGLRPVMSRSSRMVTQLTPRPRVRTGRCPPPRARRTTPDARTSRDTNGRRRLLTASMFYGQCRKSTCLGSCRQHGHLHRYLLRKQNKQSRLGWLLASMPACRIIAVQKRSMEHLQHSREHKVTMGLLEMSILATVIEPKTR